MAFLLSHTGTTKRFLAKSLGITEFAIFNWQKRNAPPPARLYQLCSFFNDRLRLVSPLSPDELLHGDLQTLMSRVAKPRPLAVQDEPTFAYVADTDHAVKQDTEIIHVGGLGDLRVTTYKVFEGMESMPHGLREMLADEFVRRYLEPTEEEITALSQIRFVDKKLATKKFFIDALLEYRLHRDRVK